MNRVAFVVTIIVLLAAAFWLGRLSRGNAAEKNSAAHGATLDKTTITESAGRVATEPAPAAVTASAALAALQHKPGSEARDNEEMRLLEQWAQSDPVGALEYAKTKFKLDRLAQAQTLIFTAWAHSAPETAWTWITKNLPGQMQHLDLVIDEAAKTDPALATRLAASYATQHPESGQELFLSAIQGMSYSGRFAEAKQIIETLPVASAQDREALDNFLAGQWARYQPAEAAAWIATLPAGPARDEAITNLGESWSDTDPAAAAQFALELPAGQVRQTNLRQAITKWLITDPDQARSWVVNTGAHEDFDQAVVSISTETNLMNREPARALRWAETIFDDNLRLQSMSTILSTLATHDPSSATAYIQNSPNLSADERAQLLRQIAGHTP